jgi:hypothetical protein
VFKWNCNKVSVDKHLRHAFPIQNSELSEKGDALLPLHFNLSVEHIIRKVQEKSVRPGI